MYYVENVQKGGIPRSTHKANIAGKFDLQSRQMLLRESDYLFVWMDVERKANRMAGNIYVTCSTKEVHIWHAEWSSVLSSGIDISLSLPAGVRLAILLWPSISKINMSFLELSRYLTLWNMLGWNDWILLFSNGMFLLSTCAWDLHGRYSGLRYSGCIRASVPCFGNTVA